MKEQVKSKKFPTRLDIGLDPNGSSAGWIPSIACKMWGWLEPYKGRGKGRYASTLPSKESQKRLVSARVRERKLREGKVQHDQSNPTLTV